MLSGLFVQILSMKFDASITNAVSTELNGVTSRRSVYVRTSVRSVTKCAGNKRLYREGSILANIMLVDKVSSPIAILNQIVNVTGV